MGMVFAQQRAPQQPVLSAYSSLEEPLAKTLFDQFTFETGVRVNYTHYSGDTVLARLEAEKDDPRASIWVGGTELDHLNAKIKSLTYPTQSREVYRSPEKYRDPQNFWIGICIDPITIVTNMDRARALGLTPPRSWAELLKPEYRGHIRMTNPGVSWPSFNLLSVAKTLHGRDDDLTFNYLRRLDTNINQYAYSESELGRGVASGQNAISIGYARDFTKHKANGANLEIVIPTEGTGYELICMSIVYKGKEPVGASMLYEWILSSPNAQRIFTDQCYILVRERTRKHPLTFALVQLNTIIQNTEWDGAPVNRRRLLDRWSTEIGFRR